MAGRFAPKEPVNLDPPKDDIIAKDYLAKCDGTHEGYPIWVAIKGTVFDVSGKKDSYGPGGSYHIFSGKDASYGLGKSSLKIEDAHGDYSGLDEGSMETLNNWFTFFSKRYNIVGVVEGTTKSDPESNL
ncbi:Neudesin [Dactylella cylindrospora]|nr:Neudesin [Dactylella cylindrospora]